jgi:hypothetical protein
LQLAAPVSAAALPDIAVMSGKLLDKILGKDRKEAGSRKLSQIGTEPKSSFIA